MSVSGGAGSADTCASYCPISLHTPMKRIRPSTERELNIVAKRSQGCQSSDGGLANEAPRFGPRGRPPPCSGPHECRCATLHFAPGFKLPPPFKACTALLAGGERGPSSVFPGCFSGDCLTRGCVLHSPPCAVGNSSHRSFPQLWKKLWKFQGLRPNWAHRACLISLF